MRLRGVEETSSGLLQAARVAAILQGRWVEIDESEWPEILAVARAHRVEQLVFMALERGTCPRSAPPPELAQLAGRYLLTAAGNKKIFADLRDALQVLEEAGVQVVVLKGAALAETVYGDPGLRPMVDVDLLVRREHVERAVSALLAAGFRRAGPPELRPGFDRDFRVEIEMVSAGAQPVGVEIHWHLTGPLFVCRRVNYPGLWSRVVPASVASRSTLVLGPEDWVLHLVAHACYKHRQLSLLDLCDLDRLIRFFGERLDWELLLALGEERRWLPAFAMAIEWACRLLETPVPEFVVTRARSCRLPPLERWLIEWWMKPGRPERAHVFPDWLTLPSLGARLRILRAYLVPSREYLASCYLGRSGGVRLVQHLRSLWAAAP